MIIYGYSCLILNNIRSLISFFGYLHLIIFYRRLPIRKDVPWLSIVNDLSPIRRNSPLAILHDWWVKINPLRYVYQGYAIAIH